jgi:hypothetical protein
MLYYAHKIEALADAAMSFGSRVCRGYNVLNIKVMECVPENCCLGLSLPIKLFIITTFLSFIPEIPLPEILIPDYKPRILIPKIFITWIEAIVSSLLVTFYHFAPWSRFPVRNA